MVSVGQTFIRGDTAYKSLSISIRVNCICKRSRNFPDINSFASKLVKRKIVEVNSEWKLYKENKEKSTLPLKEAMLLFLAFGSRLVERSEHLLASNLLWFFSLKSPATSSHLRLPLTGASTVLFP